MTLHRPAPPAPHPRPLTPVTHDRPNTAVTGTFIVEVVAPGGVLDLAQRCGMEHWDVRAWPVARLGDFTLELRPRLPHLGPDVLRADLQRAGITPLGPVRERHWR